MFRQFDEACAVGKFHVFFAEVEFQFHKGNKFKQLFAQRCEHTAESAAHLAYGNAVGGA